MATHSSTLAWKILWTEEPDRLQSMRLWRVGHDWATSLSLFTFMHWRRKWQPTLVFLPGESQEWQSLVGCCLWGRRVGHDWSDLAAAAGVWSSVNGQRYLSSVSYPGWWSAVSLALRKLGLAEQRKWLLRFLCVVPLVLLSQQVTVWIMLYVESLSATCLHHQNADRNTSIKKKKKQEWRSSKDLITNS